MSQQRAPRGGLAAGLLLASALVGLGCSGTAAAGPTPRVTGPTAGGAKRVRRKPPWYRDISKVKVSPRSARIIEWLTAAGGWGRGRFQIDFSMHVLTADAKTPMRRFKPTDEFYRPDCDEVPMPVPPGGAVEGERGYACKDDGDCHLLVYHGAQKKLYEMWRADLRGDTFRGGCLAVWDLRRAYGPSGRGQGCTSADAAGLPISPLLANADEVARGEIRHALRFILPNPRIKRRTYVAPGTHSTNPTRGGPNAPPYGVRFRLRPDYPVDKLKTKGARVIARALQRYGMFLADAGNIVLTVQSDRFSKHKWAGVLGPHDLRPLQVRDFQVVELGREIAFTGDCRRR